MSTARAGRFRFQQTLTFKVVLGFVAIIIINTLVIGAVLYYRSLSYVQDEKNLYGQSLSRNVSAGVDSVLERMDRVAKILIGDPDIQAILRASESPSYTITQRLADANTIAKLLLSLTSFQDHFVIAFYDADGHPLFWQPESFASVPSNLFNNVWLLLNRWRVDSRQLYFVPAYLASTTLAGGDQAFYVVRALTRLEDSSVIAYVTVVADSSALNAIIEANVPARRHVMVAVLDRQDRVAVSNDALAIGRPYSPRSDAYDSYETLSDRSGLVTSVELPPTYIASDRRSIQNFVLLISLVTMIGSLILSLILSTRILRPLRTFAGSMAVVADGDFDVALPEAGLDADMLRLHRGFNRMVQEIRRLIHDVYEQSLLAKSAQLEALQYQINPHFLYNTLQTMEAIGEVHNVEEIRVIASALARLFRYNIEPSLTVTLGEEIGQVETYFEIERVRFGSALELRTRIDESLRNRPILKFILQPIVENAIIHGFRSASVRPYIIEITAVAEGSTMAISVRDTGPGIGAEALGRLRQHIVEDSAPGSRREIGLANVHRRLANYYGSAGGLEFPRERGWGTVVRITIPMTPGGKIVDAQLQTLGR
jgi:two-component system, sensor histidine kinase YesM